MNLTTTQKLSRFSSNLFKNIKVKSSTVSMAMIIAALFAFEAFNFSSTRFALGNILGGQSSGGISWAAILALAFCGMDFAGIARLLGPQEEREDRGGWYLLGAWCCGRHERRAQLVGRELRGLPHGGVRVIMTADLVTVVPVLVAVMVWVIRILIIGTLVTSFNQTVNDKAPVKTNPQQTRPFGFKPNSNPVPAGYQPINHVQGVNNNHR